MVGRHEAAGCRHDLKFYMAFTQQSYKLYIGLVGSNKKKRDYDLTVYLFIYWHQLPQIVPQLNQTERGLSTDY